MKNIFIILICFTFGNVHLFAQEFRKQQSFKIDAVGVTKKNIPSDKINLDNNQKLDEKTIAEYTKKIKPEPLKEFVLEQQPKAKDIMEKRIWMGKEVTNKTIQSNVSIGNVTTKSKRVKIEFRDFGLIDGDRIRIYLNEKILKENIVLAGNYFFVYINLDSGFNRIDIEALSEGLVGPNTAEIYVFNEKGQTLTTNYWNLALSEIATLTIIKN